MATISSALRLQDQFSSVIQKNINEMFRMADAVENLNREGDMSGLENGFAEMRQEVSLAQHELDGFNDRMNEVDKHENGLRRMGDGFDGLSKAIVVVNQGLELIQKAWGAIDKLGTASDDRISADARLGNILDSLRTQEQLEAQVMQVANDTRAEYAATAELIARMGRQDYFKGNNDKALDFAATLNKGLVVSGASAMEAKSALTQLSQGIASGVLRGEEFNSIMENGSVLAEMMATSLGVTKGQLRAMAEDGMLTTDVVVSSIMAQADAIDEQFARMPVTYGQAKTVMGNLTSDLMDTLAQPGMGIDIIITKVQELTEWAATADGAVFFSNMALSITAVLEGLASMALSAGEIYLFISENWSTIEPILWGLATAVGGVSLAYMTYKGILTAMAIAEGIHNASMMLSTGAKLADTAAQWGLNAALLACPITWIVVAIMVLIGVIVALTIWVIDLWQTNIDFRVGVIQVWNSILGFFDRVPLFFQGIGYGIADAFSWVKITVLQILENLINGAIDRINRLIELANSIPGVSIDTVGAVSFAAEAAIQEEAARAARAAKLAEAEASVVQKAAERERQLMADADRWRSEAEAKKAKEDQQAGTVPQYSSDYSREGLPPVELAGGSIDKVGKIGSEVDISDQSLQYLNDIAEVRLLESIESTSSLQLSKSDAELMRTSAQTADTNVYYIQYTGGVKVNNDITQGADWPTMRKQLEDELQLEIDTGISGIEEVLYHD